MGKQRLRHYCNNDDVWSGGDKITSKNFCSWKFERKKIFLAGETKHGKIYLLGGDAGVSGKSIKVEGNLITIYDGMCTIGFGG
jgi:hypothetical protein